MSSHYDVASLTKALADSTSFKAAPLVLKYGTKEITLDTSDVQDALDTLHDTVEFDLTMGQLREMLMTDIDIPLDILRYGAGDTEVREKLANGMSAWLGLERWPDFRKTEEQRADFAKRFDAAALAKGLKAVG